MLNSREFIVDNDEGAVHILSNFLNVDNLSKNKLQNEAVELIKIALKTASLHSFIENQTYPRPSHPKAILRKSPYFTFVGVIVSLRCTLETEQAVMSRLLSQVRNEKELLEIDIVKLEAIIRPSGMAKKKALWINEGLLKIRNDNQYSLDFLSRAPINECRERILLLKGVGPKAADCFLLAGMNRLVFPIDVNVFTLIAKMFPYVIASNYPDFSNGVQVSRVKSFLEIVLPQDVKLYQILHTYLLLANKHRVI